ncbi:hypothetical protein C9374_003209 [Naegleria lovaniensis]|uniref:Uncharacterized protein n=1 Tax=Naegleria lovaniensis TaxID=51637 RepID=A0AA88GNM2_NAELO|nr:uncharacterized protein C9374_003209 [Naegleria lovaniensis]KAG2386060.1 hypothetical protein C9374_003209 [Naegleria lovaniensis]
MGMFSKVKAIKERKANIWSHGPPVPSSNCSPMQGQGEACESKKQKHTCKESTIVLPPPVLSPQQQVWSGSVAAGGVPTTLNPTVSLPLDKYLEILQQFQQQQKFLEEHFDDSVISADDQPYIVRSMDIKGSENHVQKADDSVPLKDLIGKDEPVVHSCKFEVTYMVDILENVSKKQKAILQKNNLLLSKKLWTQCVLLSNVQRRIALRNCVVKYLGNESNETDKVNCHVSIDGNDIILLTDTAGLYEVKLNVDVNYSNIESLKNETSPRQISLSLPNAVTSNFEFLIMTEKCQVKITPALFFEQSNISLNDKTITRIFTQLPSLSSLNIEWTPEVTNKIDKILQESVTEEKESDEVVKVALPVSISSTQNSSCLIGEGVINTKSRFEYSIVNGSITSLEIAINPFGLPFRIISVTGSSIKEWHLVSEENSGEGLKDEQLEDAQTFVNARKKLVVTFSREIESSYTLEVTHEADMGGTSALVKTPSLSTLNTVRETGTLAIIAKTVIEIVEKSRKYLRKIDVSELPHVHKQSGFPILMGYRFLENQHELQLDVIRHADVAVLSTSVDNCKYSITLSSDKLLHKMSMSVYNTTKQYLRVSLPKQLAGAEVWSTTVDGSTVKPGQEVRGDVKTILIPLNKKQATTAMNIDFTFTVPSKVMSSSGTIDVTLAKIDCPISKLNLAVFLPKGYKYGEFEGNIQEIKNSFLTNTISDSVVGLKRFAKKKQFSNQKIAQVSEAFENEIQQEFYDSGVNPVNLSSLDTTSGQIKFSFQRILLLENEAIATSVKYKEITKYWFQRRNLTGFRPTTIIFFSLIILFIAIVVYYKLMRTIVVEASDSSSQN